MYMEKDFQLQYTMQYQKTKLFSYYFLDEIKNTVAHYISKLSTLVH